MANISTSSLAAFSRRPAILGALALGLLVIAGGGSRTAEPRFYPDDPIQADDDMALDASKVVPIEDTGGYDFIVNTFGQPGSREAVRAKNVSTIDEVPDSSWFVNRLGQRALSVEEMRRGPDRVASISLEGWRVSSGKSTGVQPGFRMTDPAGQLYQIEFDPPSNPEMASGAEIIGTAFYHAFGYHTVDVYLAELDPARIVIAPEAKVWDRMLGDRRTLQRRDVRAVLRRAARQPNGKYRVLVSRFADGKPLGNFRYYRTRPDDPNDIVPHEHRRELRAARVFGAWLNHDDSRGVNSLDMLATGGGRAYVKHYMFDFGSILGSGTVFAQRHRAGNEYLLEWKPGWLTLATLGIYTRPWMHIDYPEVPASVGRFEGDAFDPERWRPEYPNPAFANMRADDAFWAARIVSRVDDEAIRAIVEKARYSDPRATEYVTATLITRRDKVVAHWLTQVNPLTDFALSERGELTFTNAAEQAGVAAKESRYAVTWARFDNATGVASDITGGETQIDSPRASAPESIASTQAAPALLEVRVSTTHPKFPAWKRPVTVHFRRQASGWQLVGVDRLPQ